MNSNSQLGESFSFATADETHLIKLTQQHPWCSVAQLYLLSAYKKNSQQFEQQALKTALFFNNTNWLKWQLHLLSSEKNKEETEVTTEEIPGANEEKVQDENIKKLLADVSSHAASDEETIAFEPLHTVDYFASQGIKITEEPVTNDKLATQMKSFTEWLKSMKKIHAPNIPGGDEQTDKKIQRIAEGSNTDADVVTEAMADVLVKQNKIERAIEVYQKLSLINPTKSAYFAAKINGLKAT